jgi:hypothetical protein
MYVFRPLLYQEFNILLPAYALCISEEILFERLHRPADHRSFSTIHQRAVPVACDARRATGCCHFIFLEIDLAETRSLPGLCEQPQQGFDVQRRGREERSMKDGQISSRQLRRRRRGAAAGEGKHGIRAVRCNLHEREMGLKASNSIRYWITGTPTP